MRASKRHAQRPAAAPSDKGEPLVHKRHSAAGAEGHSQAPRAYQAAALLGAKPQPSRFEAERILAELLADAGLPAPRINQRLHGWEVDLYWPDHAVVLELDGFDAHGGHRAGFERDHRKAVELEAGGVRVLRVSGAQVSDDRPRIVAMVAGSLAATQRA